MNTDERGYFDALTKRVRGAVFAPPSWHPGCCRSCISSHL